jgi:hypothetical protein
MKNKKVLIWSLGVIAVSALGLVVYMQIQRKKETEELEKSIKEITDKYNVFK